MTKDHPEPNIKRQNPYKKPSFVDRSPWPRVSARGSGRPGRNGPLDPRRLGSGLGDLIFEIPTLGLETRKGPQGPLRPRTI